MCHRSDTAPRAADSGGSGCDLRPGTSAITSIAVTATILPVALPTPVNMIATHLREDNRRWDVLAGTPSPAYRPLSGGVTDTTSCVRFDDAAQEESRRTCP